MTFVLVPLVCLVLMILIIFLQKSLLAELAGKSIVDGFYDVMTGVMTFGASIYQVPIFHLAP